MGKTKSWIMELEELAYEGYCKGLRGADLKAYVKQRSSNYDAGYLDHFIKMIESD